MQGHSPDLEPCHASKPNQQREALHAEGCACPAGFIDQHGYNTSNRARGVTLAQRDTQQTLTRRKTLATRPSLLMPISNLESEFQKHNGGLWTRSVAGDSGGLSGWPESKACRFALPSRLRPNIKRRQDRVQGAAEALPQAGQYPSCACRSCQVALPCNCPALRHQPLIVASLA